MERFAGAQLIWADYLPMGLCIGVQSPPRQIVINSLWWQGASALARRQRVNETVALHEGARDATTWGIAARELPVGGRLTWVSEIPLADWEWLLDQDGGGGGVPRWEREVGALVQ